MGWDMLGRVEIKRDGLVSDAVNIEPIITGRNYAMFASLFGVLNDLAFRPVAGLRGLPPDAAARTVEEANGYVAIKPDEPPSDRNRGFVSWMTWAEITQIDWEEASANPDLRLGRPMRRAEAMDQEWAVLFEIMQRLASLCGNENVRLVVYFDY